MRSLPGGAVLFPEHFMSLELLQKRVRVALGQEPGDLLLTGGSVVNVFTARIEPANVVVCDGSIAAVGPGLWPARETRDVTGKFILPGLIDSHMHLGKHPAHAGRAGSLLLPLGTTATISDSHEIGNVHGLRGIDLLIEASKGLPFDLFFVASSCVPCTSGNMPERPWAAECWRAVEKAARARPSRDDGFPGDSRR